MRRTRPLENVDKVLASFDQEFETAWDKDEIQGWEKDSHSTNATAKETSTAEAVWCEDVKGIQERKRLQEPSHRAKTHQGSRAAKTTTGANSPANGTTGTVSATRLKGARGGRTRVQSEAPSQRHEHRAKRHQSQRRAQARHDGTRARPRTREPLQRRRHSPRSPRRRGGRDEDGEERIYNPLKLPLAWDGKPIPFWLYRLHGLGVEFPCEICGNFVYMGRRAFDKHFNEARHIYGLKCLGITNTTLFRDIHALRRRCSCGRRFRREEAYKEAGIVVDVFVCMVNYETGVSKIIWAYYDHDGCLITRDERGQGIMT
ncbi:hypothetical protein Lal_00007135 [Lupinus albus]|nr:hypothetical protein Lal_00007135 [Lupinus albus]